MAQLWVNSEQLGQELILLYLGKDCPGKILPFEPVREKTNNLGSDQVRHKPGCTVTEDGKRLEILDLESKGIVLSAQQK